MEDLLKRINELANKAKTVGLDNAEKIEQTELRAAYIKNFRAGFKSQLMNLKIVDKEGTDVTPEKLKQEQEKNKNN